MRVKTYVFRVEVEQEEDGRWSAVIPTLPGCGVWGHTRAEAIQALKEAAHAYLLTLAEQGRLPEEPEGDEVFDQAPVVAVRV